MEIPAVREIPDRPAHKVILAQPALLAELALRVHRETLEILEVRGQLAGKVQPDQLGQVVRLEGRVQPALLDLLGLMEIMA